MQDIERIAPGTQNASSPLVGVATAGQPEQEHLEKLAGAGYKTVVDLREPEEDRGFDEAEAVRGVGIEYVNLPLAPEPEAFDDEEFDRFRSLMTDPVVARCWFIAGPRPGSGRS